MRKRDFMSKVVQMSSVMIIFNISDICYSIYMSKVLGAESIGVFHLIMNVFAMGVSLSVSGMTLTTTRLLSDSGASEASANSILKKCIRLCLVTSGFSAAILFCFSDFIASKIIKVPECALSLRMLTPVLLCIGVSAPLNGYFTAFGKVGAISVGKCLSHGVMWVSGLYFFGRIPPTQGFLAAVLVRLFAEGSETVCDVIMWKISSGLGSGKSDVSYRKIIKLCMPIALGSFLRTGLSSGENLLIPILTDSGGLASYGILKGMAMPVMMFPYVFMGAFNSLMVPEIARRRALNYKNSIRYITKLTIRDTLKFSLIVFVFFFLWHGKICSLFFRFEKAGTYLLYLSFFPVLMFLDSSVDAILKGLDQQVFSLKINTADSVMRIILILILVPKYGIVGYIGVMYISEIINLGASYWKLKAVTAQ